MSLALLESEYLEILDQRVHQDPLASLDLLVPLDQKVDQLDHKASLENQDPQDLLVAPLAPVVILECLANQGQSEILVPLVSLAPLDLQVDPSVLLVLQALRLAPLALLVDPLVPAATLAFQVILARLVPQVRLVHLETLGPLAHLVQLAP